MVVLCRSFCFLTWIVLCKVCSSDGDFVNDNSIEAEAVKGLIRRLIPAHAENFNIRINSSVFHEKNAQDSIFLNENSKSLDCFKVTSISEKVIEIIATSGVAAAWGFQHYLKYTCDCHVSWSGNQLHLPDILPNINESLHICSPYRYRYYQNVCTTSYSFVWWNWRRWEKEIDWMAMNGINLPLAFNGMEYIWKKVYKGLGFTDTELKDHFAGPAFLAWQRMGNMHGWGGPLPDYWMLNQYNLQKKILARMREFGMTPVLPGFAGHVPSSILRVFPNANVTKLEAWGKFNTSYCCTDLLEPSDPLFKQIGKTFTSEIIKNFGTDHFYNMDTFNEMRPRTNNTEYIMNFSRSVFEAMNIADNKGIWIVQGWLFLDHDFWHPQQIRSYLQGVPLGRMIVLDLHADVHPLYNETNSFYGQPFIWCMLHNFGGNQRLYGILPEISKGPLLAAQYQNSTMIGIGITPEGINQNDIVYELMNEMGWRDSPVNNITAWVSNFTRRRYGDSSPDSDEGWNILINTVYNCWDNHSDHNRGVPVIRPSLHLKNDMWYNISDIMSAWKSFIFALPTMGTSSTFRYDLISITVQALQDYSYIVYTDLIEAYRKYDTTLIRLHGAFLLEIIAGMERILLTDERYLLGKWIDDSEHQAENEKDKELFAFNARNQVTLWGPGPKSILDYANKMWASLVISYYYPRWNIFVSALIECGELQTKLNTTWIDELIYIHDYAWNFDNMTKYPNEPTGNTLEVARELYEEIYPLFVRRYQYSSTDP